MRELYGAKVTPTWTLVGMAATMDPHSDDGGTMRNLPGPLGLAALLGLALILASTVSQAADVSVEARLKARDIPYELGTDGDYKITYSYDKEGRSQQVFISGTVETVDAMKIREIYAAAGKVDEDGINGAMALKLLAESQTKKIGSWELDGNILFYVIKLPDSVDAAGLESAIKIAAELADDKEIELSGKKDSL